MLVYCVWMPISNSKSYSYFSYIVEKRCIHLRLFAKTSTKSLYYNKGTISLTNLFILVDHRIDNEHTEEGEWLLDLLKQWTKIMKIICSDAPSAAPRKVIRSSNFYPLKRLSWQMRQSNAVISKNVHFCICQSGADREVACEDENFSVRSVRPWSNESNWLGKPFINTTRV